MVTSAPRVLILFICMGLLTFQPDKVSGLQNTDFVLKHEQHNQELMQQNQRSLNATNVKVTNTEKKPTQTDKKFDPNQSSKRRVRRGSDPIHNRS